ncbi:MAG TPA: hypothetical protein VFT70_16965 [Nocardioides sp.]|nr:hypothetical protein [Nocardioides sp.]
MSTLTVSLGDPGFTPAGAGGEGSLIDDLRDDCGFIVQGIDWVLRQIGIDLIALIFDPLAGDFDAVDAMAANWKVLGSGLGEIGQNYSILAGATPSVWTGDAGSAAVTKMSDFAGGFEQQAEGAQLISTALEDMLTATKAVMEVVAEAISLIDEAAMTLVTSWLKLAKELASGGETVRKIISLATKAIDAVKTLQNVVPPLLQACAVMSTMMKALDAVFRVGNVAANSNSGSKVDDIAAAGF